MKDNKIKFAEGVELIESLDVSDSARDLFYKKILNEGLGDVVSGAANAANGAKESIMLKFAKMAQKRAAKKAGDVTKITNIVNENIEAMLTVINANAIVDEAQKQKDIALLKKYQTEINTMVQSVVAAKAAADAAEAKLKQEHPDIEKTEKEAEAATTVVSDLIDDVDNLDDVEGIRVFNDSVLHTVKKSPNEESVAPLIDAATEKVKGIEISDAEQAKAVEMCLNDARNKIADFKAMNANIATTYENFVNALQEILDKFKTKNGEAIDDENVDGQDDTIGSEGSETEDDPESDGGSGQELDSDINKLQSDISSTKEALKQLKHERDTAVETDTPEYYELDDEIKAKEQELKNLEDKLSDAQATESVNVSLIAKLRDNLRVINESVANVRDRLQHLK